MKSEWEMTLRLLLSLAATETLAAIYHSSESIENVPAVEPVWDCDVRVAHCVVESLATKKIK